jgi:hypothetical protein
MQCIADIHGGVRRFYRLVTVINGTGENAFTGDRNDGIEIWSWPNYPPLGEAPQAANQAFVDAYNRRMQRFVADAATQPAG